MSYLISIIPSFHWAPIYLSTLQTTPAQGEMLSYTETLLSAVVISILLIVACVLLLITAVKDKQSEKQIERIKQLIEKSDKQ